MRVIIKTLKYKVYQNDKLVAMFEDYLNAYDWVENLKKLYPSSFKIITDDEK